MITLYGIKNCDSVKKAQKFFKEHAIDVAFVDFRENPVEPSKVANWAKQSDLSKPFNNRSRTYKDLGLAKENLEDTDKISWMQKEPLLIKRPVIEYGDQLIVGFDASKYKEVFKV